VRSAADHGLNQTVANQRVANYPKLGSPRNFSLLYFFWKEKSKESKKEEKRRKKEDRKMTKKKIVHRETSSDPLCILRAASL